MGLCNLIRVINFQFVNTALQVYMSMFHWNPGTVRDCRSTLKTAFIARLVTSKM